MQKRTEIIPAIAHFILRASNHSVDYVVNEIRPAPLPNSERGREGRVFAYSIFAMFECYMYVALPEQFACERMRSDERMQDAGRDLQRSGNLPLYRGRISFCMARVPR